MSAKPTWQEIIDSLISEKDALPCPECGSKDLEFFQNVVQCSDCGHTGPNAFLYPDGRQMPEFMCDWREAIEEWNSQWQTVEGPAF